MPHSPLQTNGLCSIPFGSWAAVSCLNLLYLFATKPHRDTPVSFPPLEITAAKCSVLSKPGENKNTWKPSHPTYSVCFLLFCLQLAQREAAEKCLFYSGGLYLIGPNWGLSEDTHKKGWLTSTMCCLFCGFEGGTNLSQHEDRWEASERLRRWWSPPLLPTLGHFPVLGKRFFKAHQRRVEITGFHWVGSLTTRRKKTIRRPGHVTSWEMIHTWSPSLLQRILRILMAP